MKDIQEIFDRIRETKKEQKALKALYKDTLESSQDYRQLKEKLDELKTRKKQLEHSAWEEVGGREKDELLKSDLAMDRELLSDLALSNLMKGETVKVIDEDGHEHEPLFSVRFKKTNVIGKS